MHHQFRIFLAVILVAASIGTGLATESRMASMGGVGYYTRDNSNIYIYPGSIYRYSKQVISELRAKNATNLYTVGVNVPLGESAVVGVHLNRPLGISWLNRESVAVDRTTDLLLGTKAGSMDLGFRFSLAMDKASQEIGTNNKTWSVRYLALGGGVSSDDFDAAFFVELPAYNYEYEKFSSSQSGMGFGLNLRYFARATNELEVIPVFTVLSRPSSYTYDTGITGAKKDETDYSSTNLGVGVGLNYALNANNLIVVAVEGFGLNTATTSIKEGTETTSRTITRPGLYFGVESKISKYFIGRLGGAQVFQSDYYNKKPVNGNEESSTTYNTQFKVTFGLGIVFGKFTLDASINESILFDGPNVLSGSSEPLAHKLSITYGY